MKLLHKMTDFLATEILFKDNIKVILICAKHFSFIHTKKALNFLYTEKKNIIFFSSLLTEVFGFFYFLWIIFILNRFSHLATVKLL